MKYQIGSALVSGKERIILHVQGKYIDIVTVLSDARLTEALSLHQAKPASLMQMMQHWSYWRAKLSSIVEYWFGYSEQDRRQSQIKADELIGIHERREPVNVLCLELALLPGLFGRAKPVLHNCGKFCSPVRPMLHHLHKRGRLRLGQGKCFSETNIAQYG